MNRGGKVVVWVMGGVCCGLCGMSGILGYGLWYWLASLGNG